MVGEVVAGMQVSNFLTLLKTTQVNLSHLVIQHDAFAELSAKSFPEILVEEGKFTLYPKSRANKHVAWQSGDTSFADFSQLLESLKRVKTVVLSVSAELCLLRHAEFPVSVKARIGALLELELQRVTPFKLDDVYHGWIEGRADKTNIWVDQYTIKKDIIAPLQDALAQRGISTEAVLIRQADGQATRLAFAPNGTKYALFDFDKWKKRLALAAGLYILGLAAVVASIQSYHSRQSGEIKNSITNLQPVIKKVKQEIESSRSLQNEVAAIQMRRQNVSNRIKIVSETTKIMPDNAYLMNLSITDRHIALEGMAEKPEQLITLLEDSPLFNNVAFASTVFNTPGDRFSHFAINMDLESQK